MASTSDSPSIPNSSKNQKSAQNTAKQSSYISAPPPFSPIKRDKKPVDPEETSSAVGNATEESFVVGQNNPSTSTGDSRTTEESVPCPVCQVRVPKRSINVHLDECLQEQAGGPRKKPPQTTATTPNVLSSGIPKKASLKPMRKVVYHLIKDSELKKMLKAEGLSVKGNRRTLEWR